MAKVTSKLQVTIPKAIAALHSIKPGDEVDWSDAGNSIRLEPVHKRPLQQVTVDDRLKWFDEATQRQQLRQSAAAIPVASPGAERGWMREELYSRGGVD